MIAAKGGFARIVDVVLPNGGGVMVMFEGYFDESGDFEVEPKIFSISGYFIEAEAAKSMDEEWRRVLVEHRIPYFHMVDCAHGNGVFAGKRKEERSEIVKKLIELTKKYTLEGFSAIVQQGAFTPSEDDGDEYTYCAHMGAAALKLFLANTRVDGEVSYFFEAGHKSRGRAYSKIAEEIEDISASLTFAKKTDVRLLQAADLLAWQTVKYAKDRLSGTRPPRKDFMSLMEHDHCFFYPTIRDGEKGAIAIELWPLYRRSSETTKVMSTDDAGPITFFYEEGESRPIITVDRTEGHRGAWGLMTYVAFKEMTGKQFILSFDEPRLLDTIVALIAASDMYKGNHLVPFMSAEDVHVEVDDDAVTVVVKPQNGGALAFHFPKEVLEKLKASLDEV